jgi:hypothetical protein
MDFGRVFFFLHLRFITSGLYNMSSLSTASSAMAVVGKPSSNRPRTLSSQI